MVGLDRKEAKHKHFSHFRMTSESSPLVSMDAENQGAWAARWNKAKHVLVPVILDIVPDTALGYLVQYSRDDPGARILTAFTFASIVQSQVVSALQLSLKSKVDWMRGEFADPIKRGEMWIYSQAAWLVYMSYIPFAAAACGYTSWAARDAIFGQNADVSDVVASLLIINLISLPFSLGSAIMRSELEAEKSLQPFVVAFGISWTIGLTFAYVLGYWVELGFVGIALTDIITYSIQFRLLVPRTRVFDEWPGWRLREASRLMPALACHPAMLCILAVNLSMMLFGFTSLLASLIKVNVVIESATNNVFLSLLMLGFMPLFGISLRCSMVIKDGLNPDAQHTVTPTKLIVLVILLTIISSFAWIVGGLHVGVLSLPTWAIDASQSLLSVLVPLFPSLGFVFLIRPVFRTCAELWHHAYTYYLVAMIAGAGLGAAFAEDLDGGIQGLWFGQYICLVGFVVAATAWITSKGWVQSHDRQSIAPSSSAAVVIMA